MMHWDLDKAKEVYNIPYWSGGYCDINSAGHLQVSPRRDRQGTAVDLYRLSQEARAAGLSLPLLVRFTDILHDRIDGLCRAFAQAMSANDYQAAFTAVYPIKVNQQRRVVEEILRHGDGRVGLEAGSKPELMAVLALAPAGGVVICNGYKDREYVRLALIGRQLGQRVYIVVEKLSEVETILEEAQALGVQPLLGVRVRLAAIGAGKWQNTGGEKSKFGLSASQALNMVERLRQADSLASLELMHFHMGSQISNIRDIHQGMREAARYYAELHRLGVPIRCVDVGGGLGVDYEGTASRSFYSMNYTVQEYANNVVHALWDVCAGEGLPQPDILTEAGRAMTAHHAVLITEVIDHELASDGQTPAPPAADDPSILQDLWQGARALTSRNAIEAYHDAAHALSEAQGMYTHGIISLEQRARAETLYHTVCARVQRLLNPATRAHREVLDELSDKLADKYFCNFSVFQSIPDVWAIDQIFPIVPLHRLDEQPTRRAVIGDLTCDSDGRIDYYVDGEGIETTLPLHDYQPGQPYLLGVFLVGAYQEILGDMHNLFGDTDAVNVELTADGGYRLIQPQRGDTAEALLRYVHFDAEALTRIYRQRIDQAALSAEERQHYLRLLEAGLKGYTYLEH